MKSFLKISMVLIVTMMLGNAFAAMPFKHNLTKYGVNSECVFTSGTVIKKIWYTPQTSAGTCDLYNAITETGSPLLKAECPTAYQSVLIFDDADGTSSFSTGLYVKCKNATDWFTVEYSNS